MVCWGVSQHLCCNVPKPGPSLRTSKGFLEGPERMLLSWERPWKKVGPWAAGVDRDQSAVCTGGRGRWEVVKGLGSILSGDGELLTSEVMPSDLLSEGWSPGGGHGLGASPEGDSGGEGSGKHRKSCTKVAPRDGADRGRGLEEWGRRDREEASGSPSLGLGVLWRHTGWRLGGRHSVLPCRSGVWWFLVEKPCVAAGRWGDRLGPRVCRVGG